MYDCDEDLSREAATPSRAPDRRGWAGARLGASLVCSLLAVLAVGLMALAGPARGAPAPLPRHDRPAPPSIPASCLMHCGGTYRAQFLPGGAYRAEGTGGARLSFAGSWEYDRVNRLLVITERAEWDGLPAGEYHRYEFEMEPSLRRGRSPGGSLAITLED